MGVAQVGHFRVKITLRASHSQTRTIAGTTEGPPIDPFCCIALAMGNASDLQEHTQSVVFDEVICLVCAYQ